MEEQNISNSWVEAWFGNNELNQLVGVTGEEPVDNPWTWFGNSHKLKKVGISGTEHFDNIDYFWDHAYQKINTISVSSWILFFIIFYLIATYIKYSLKHSKDKSSTYKQILKDSMILIISIGLSIIVASLVYIFIDYKAPPCPCEWIDGVLRIYGLIALIILILTVETIYIILHKREENIH